MATERVTQRPDGSRIVERDDGMATAGGGGGGAVGIIVGLAVLALVAIVAFFLLTSNRNDTLRTTAVTGAASSVSHAADNVGAAASRAADNVAPQK